MVARLPKGRRHARFLRLLIPAASGEIAGVSRAINSHKFCRKD